MACRVEIEFHRAASALIPEGRQLVAAVSGGGDSVALLHLLLRYAGTRAIAVGVAHLDHGLRRGSKADRGFVEKLARELGLAFWSDRREVATLRRRRESPEEAARRVRRGFLLEARQRLGADLVVTGHTLDDQAETVLMRLVRGAGPAALAGMAPSGPGPFLRPLLSLEREVIRSYLERRGLPFRDDPSNRDLRFDRNRVRQLIVPCLKQALNPRAPRQLVRAAERLRADAAYLDTLAEELVTRLVRQEPRGLRLELAGLSGAAAPLATRVVARALQNAGADRRRIASRHIEAVLQLARGPGPGRLDLPSGLQAVRRGGGVLWLTRRPDPER